MPPIAERTENRGIPKTKVLHFRDFMPNDPPEWPIGARIEEIRGYVPGLFSGLGPGSRLVTKPPFFATRDPSPAFSPSRPAPPQIDKPDPRRRKKSTAPEMYCRGRSCKSRRNGHTGLMPKRKGVFRYPHHLGSGTPPFSGELSLRFFLRRTGNSSIACSGQHVPVLPSL